MTGTAGDDTLRGTERADDISGRGQTRAAQDLCTGLPEALREQITTIRRDSAQDYIRDVAERVRESGIRSSGVAVVGAGPVSETLIDLATPERVSLMVVATHGLGGLKRMMLGSVADKVVRAARIPVLIRPVREGSAGIVDSSR